MSAIEAVLKKAGFKNGVDYFKGGAEDRPNGYGFYIESLRKKYGNVDLGFELDKKLSEIGITAIDIVVGSWVHGYIHRVLYIKSPIEFLQNPITDYVDGFKNEDKYGRDISGKNTSDFKIAYIYKRHGKQHYMPSNKYGLEVWYPTHRQYKGEQIFSKTYDDLNRLILQLNEAKQAADRDGQKFYAIDESNILVGKLATGGEVENFSIPHIGPVMTEHIEYAAGGSISFADLKRKLSKGAAAKLVSRYGQPQPGIVRYVVKTQTNGVYFSPDKNATKGSFMDFPPASLLETDDTGFRIYETGSRPLTATEQGIKDNEPKDPKQSAIDMQTDGSTMFYRVQSYYKNSGYNYLNGLDWGRGMKFDFNTGQVLDKSVKGRLALEYEFVNPNDTSATEKEETKEIFNEAISKFPKTMEQLSDEEEEGNGIGKAFQQFHANLLEIARTSSFEDFGDRVRKEVGAKYPTIYSIPDKLWNENMPALYAKLRKEIESKKEKLVKSFGTINADVKIDKEALRRENLYTDDEPEPLHDNGKTVYRKYNGVVEEGKVVEILPSDVVGGGKRYDYMVEFKNPTIGLQRESEEWLFDSIEELRAANPANKKVEHKEDEEYMADLVPESSQQDFKELDTVISIRQIGKVPMRTKGTIVFDYGNKNAYQVEFFDDQHETISVERVSKNQIEMAPAFTKDDLEATVDTLRELLADDPANEEIKASIDTVQEMIDEMSETKEKMLDVYGVSMSTIEQMAFDKYLSNNNIAMNTKTKDERYLLAKEWLSFYRNYVSKQAPVKMATGGDFAGTTWDIKALVTKDGKSKTDERKVIAPNIKEAQEKYKKFMKEKLHYSDVQFLGYKRAGAISFNDNFDKVVPFVPVDEPYEMEMHDLQEFAKGGDVNMNVETCQRCSQPTNGLTIMSMYNHDVICMKCKEEEKKRPDYKQAVDTDVAAIKSGNYNSEGIGYKELATGGELVNLFLIDNKYYLVSDDEPKDGDWVIVDGGLGRVGVDKFQDNVRYSVRPLKIAKSTDPKLSLPIIKWVIKNPKGYYSRSMQTGKPVFLDSMEMAYTYGKEEADKIREGLQKEGQTDLEVVPLKRYATGGNIEESNKEMLIKEIKENVERLGVIDLAELSNDEIVYNDNADDIEVIEWFDLHTVLVVAYKDNGKGDDAFGLERIGEFPVYYENLEMPILEKILIALRKRENQN